MTWFTKMLGLISHSQQSHNRPRGSTRLGVEVLDERALPSASPLASGAHIHSLVSEPTTLHAAVSIATETPIKNVPETTVAKTSLELPDRSTRMITFAVAETPIKHAPDTAVAKTPLVLPDGSVRGRSSMVTTTAGHFDADILFPVFTQ